MKFIKWITFPFTFWLFKQEEEMQVFDYIGMAICWAIITLLTIYFITGKVPGITVYN